MTQIDQVTPTLYTIPSEDTMTRDEWMMKYVDDMMRLEGVFNDGKPLSLRQRVSVLTRIIQRNPKGDGLAVAAEALIREALQEREAGEWMFSLRTGPVPPSAPAHIKELARALDRAQGAGDIWWATHRFILAWNDWGMPAF